MFNSDKVQTLHHYNTHAPAMKNQPWFYEWVLSVVQSEHISKNQKICDFGCGNGTLLAYLDTQGDLDLQGFDFSTECVELSRRSIPHIQTFVHDIEVSHFHKLTMLLL